MLDAPSIKPFSSVWLHALQMDKKRGGGLACAAVGLPVREGRN